MKPKTKRIEYPCYLSPTQMCRYGGNKYYNLGFMSGTASYCRKDKKWVSELNKCPLIQELVESELDDGGGLIVVRTVKGDQ